MGGAGRMLLWNRPFALQHPTAHTDTRRIAVELERLVYEADPSLNVVVEAGDIIYVPAVEKVRIFVSDVDLWSRVNATYAEFFGAHKPARAILPCGALHFGCLLELEATAYVNNG